ncbi:MAG TPA: PhnD/SsuA/transferrin family substrate-binding protein [Gemmataceae bacterium]|nr:PhnD/SsuA/transferrin family substrate-binding protein [Gemmataceae bacterium]
MSRLAFAANVALLLVVQIAPAADPKVMKVGLPKSAFRDVPPALLTFAGEPFRDLMKSQTGFDGEVVMEADAMNIARQLDTGKLHLGVFLGHEFAWAKDKYPALEPLVCSVPRPPEVQAFLLVRWDCKATGLADFKGQKLALAKNSRDHARLFLNRKRAEDMGDGGFCSTEKADTVHDAIHKVIDGEADVTVADGAAWAYFQKLYPGNSQNLRVLAKSEVFPPSVIVCKKGALSDDAVKKFHDGLMTTHESAKATKLMAVIKIEKFDELPKGYDDMLKACRKTYPTPLSDK